MTRITLPVLLSLLVLVAGCASNDDTTPEKTPEPAATSPAPDQSKVPPEKRVASGPKIAAPAAAPAGPEVAAVTFGRGIVKGNGLDVTFMHNVTRYKNGEADGEFKHSAIGDAGVIDIDVEVTCAELDSESNKGWVGGKVKRNDSTNPLYLGAVGTEVWYRILDLGETEQTAFVSMPIFKQKGIGSAAEFCEKKPWSDEGLLQLDQGALAIFP